MTEESKSNERAEAHSSSSSGTSEPQGREVTLFETRAAPWLTCLEVDKLINSKRAYDRYVRELAIATSTNGSGTKPYTMVDCVDRKMLEIICLYGEAITANVSVDDITDDELIKWLDAEIMSPLTAQMDVVSLEDLGKKYLDYDMSLKVRARVFKLFATYHDMVLVEHLKHRIKDKNAKKKGKLLIAALKPANLRQNVETYCVEVLGSVPLTDTDQLFQVIMEKAVVFDMVHGSKKSDVRDQTAPEDSHVVRSDRRGARPRDRKGKSASNPAEKSTTRVAVENNYRGGASARKKRAPMRRGVPDGGCLHCQGAHWLSDCPTATPEEVKRLFEELADKKRPSRHQARMARSHKYQTIGRNDHVMIFPQSPDVLLENDFDDGASSIYISLSMFRQLVRSGAHFDCTALVEPEPVAQAATGGNMMVIMRLYSEFSVETTAGWMLFPRNEILVV